MTYVAEPRYEIIPEMMKCLIDMIHTHMVTALADAGWYVSAFRTNEINYFSPPLS